VFKFFNNRNGEFSGRYTVKCGKYFFHFFITYPEDRYFGYQKLPDDEFGAVGTFGVGRLMLVAWVL